VINVCFFCCQPQSHEAINGAPTLEDEDESSAEEPVGVNGVPSRDGRSVSSTVHDRTRITGSATAKASSSKPHTAHGPRHSSVHSQAPHSGAPGTSPHSAREMFLGYFFGQNGPGPIAGSTVERLHDDPAPVSTGRDVSGAENSGPTGLMAGKRTLNGNNAAFDMKSLGKHIEAVSLLPPSTHTFCMWIPEHSFRCHLRNLAPK